MPLATALACKPPAKAQQSEVKTLDNFAAGTTVRVNSCSASPDARKSSDFSEPMYLAKDDRIKIDPSIGAEASSKLKEEVRSALTAVPPEMQVAFMSMGGFIDVTSKTRERCTKSFRKEGAQKTSDSELEYVTACFEFQPLSKLSDAELAELKLSKNDLVNEDGSERKGSVLRINVMPDAKDIKHAMVRSFGFTFAQLFSRMSAADEGSAPGAKLKLNKTEGFKVANLKIRVAQNFLADMVESKVFDLKTMETFLGAGAAEQIKQNYEKLKKRGSISKAIDANFAEVPPKNPKYADEDLLAGVSYMLKGETEEPTSEQRQVRRVRFYDFVFAEFFDSVYCHAWGEYPAADVVAKVKSGEMDRDTFLRSAENTLAIVKDFFPKTYALYSAADQEVKQLMTAVASQSSFKDLLKKKDGLGLAEGDLFSELLNGGGAPAPQPAPQPGQASAGNPTAAAGAGAAAGASSMSGLMGLLGQLGPALAAMPKAPAVQKQNTNNGGMDKLLAGGGGQGNLGGGGG